MNKNNFHIPENTEKAKYRLWLLIQWAYVNAKFPRKRTIYSFNTGTPANQLKRLEDYVINRKFKIEQAHLYDNQTKSDIPIKIFDPKFLSLRNLTDTEIEHFKNKNTYARKNF